MILASNERGMVYASHAYPPALTDQESRGCGLSKDNEWDCLYYYYYYDFTDNRLSDTLIKFGYKQGKID